MNKNLLIPNVIEETHFGERAWDIYSLLLKERIIFLDNDVESQISSLIVAELLYLDSIDPGKDIYLYINSPGGSVVSGLAIYDTMQYIKSDVVTICFGQASSMGAFLLSSGKKGKRYSLPNARIMIHQPLISSEGNGISGQITDIEIITKHLSESKKLLTSILAKNVGKTFAEVSRDTERNNYMTSNEAKEYGLIDHIITDISDIK